MVLDWGISIQDDDDREAVIQLISEEESQLNHTLAQSNVADDELENHIAYLKELLNAEGDLVLQKELERAHRHYIHQDS